MEQEAGSPEPPQGPTRFLGPQVRGTRGSLGCEEGLFQILKGAGSGNIRHLGTLIPPVD